MNEQIAIGIAGISITLFIWSVISLLTQPKEKNKKKREEGDERYVVEPAPPLIQGLLSVVSKIAPIFEDLADKSRASSPKGDSGYLKYINSLEKSLMTAGNPGAITPYELIGLSLVSSVLWLFLGIGLAIAIQYPIALIAITCFIIGLFLPTIWLSDRIRKRQIEIRNDLPYMLDILTLCIEAGLDFTTALRRIIDRFDESALGYELNQLLRELQIGKTRAEGLRDLSKRVNLTELSTVVGAIVQAEKMGTSMGPALRVQADEARRRRSLRAEEAALKAPVKLMFPLVAFIFPTTFIVLFAPVLIKNMPFLQNLGR